MLDATHYVDIGLTYVDMHYVCLHVIFYVNMQLNYVNIRNEDIYIFSTFLIYVLLSIHIGDM